jgi:hypothetical protein
VGYLVATTGRLLLPSGLERQALTVAEHRMSARQGWFDPDAGHVDSLDDLAAYAGVRLQRDGEWLTLTTDHDGDPKWSEQAEEFYRSLSDFVQEGEVHLRGEDGSTWSYTYAGGALAQQGDNGWDEPPATGGATAVEQDPPAAPPQTAPPGPPVTRPAQPPESSERPSPPPAAEPQEGGFSYPGKEDRPPSASPPPTPPVPAWTPGEDDDAPPASPGRAVAMTALLVVGVLLIIGLALVVSGF